MEDFFFNPLQQEPVSMKRCIDCKYFHRGFGGTVCAHDKATIGHNRVYGWKYQKSPTFMRHYFSPCKSEALLFEEKQSIIKRVIKIFNRKELHG